MNIRFTLGAVAMIALFSFSFGMMNGIRMDRKYHFEKMERDDVFDQFVDILSDSLDEDGEVWYE